MKYKIFETVEKEIEYTTPCFVKFTDNIFYKIIKERFITVVKTFDFTTSISIEAGDQCNPFGNNGWEFTTEEEYLKAEEKALNRISEYTNFPEAVKSELV